MSSSHARKHAIPVHVRNFYRRWEIVIKGIGIVIAAVWALFEYYGHNQEGRVQQVLAYRHELRTPPLFNAWSNAMLGTKDTREGAEALRKGGETWIRFSLKNADARYDDLVAVFRFYDDLRNCVRANLCDESSGRSIFGYEAQYLYDNYALFIGCRRLNEKHFADGLIVFMAAHFKKAKGHSPKIYLPSPSICSLEQQ